MLVHKFKFGKGSRNSPDSEAGNAGVPEEVIFARCQWGRSSQGWHGGWVSGRRVTLAGKHVPYCCSIFVDLGYCPRILMQDLNFIR